MNNDRASTVTDTVVEQVISVDARAETVFDFFTDPAKLVVWMGRGASLDARPGGEFRLDMAGDYAARGEYLEVDRPHRVVFTWGWESGGALPPPGASTVEVTLAESHGVTTVTLAHRGLASGQERASHAEGWQHYLLRLAVAAAGGDPGLDPWDGDNPEAMP